MISSMSFMTDMYWLREDRSEATFCWEQEHGLCLLFLNQLQLNEFLSWMFAVKFNTSLTFTFLTFCGLNFNDR